MFQQTPGTTISRPSRAPRRATRRVTPSSCSRSGIASASRLPLSAAQERRRADDDRLQALTLPVRGRHDRHLHVRSRRHARLPLPDAPEVVPGPRRSDPRAAHHLEPALFPKPRISEGSPATSTVPTLLGLAGIHPRRSRSPDRAGQHRCPPLVARNLSGLVLGDHGPPSPFAVLHDGRRYKSRHSTRTTGRALPTTR